MKTLPGSRPRRRRKKKKDDDERAQAAARLAAARGSLLVTTEPAGATVTVGTLPPRISPATFADLKLGRYPVLVTLPQHDEVRLELEVKENTVTESPLLHLVRPVGRLELNSNPAGATFEFHPANALLVAPEARHGGTTPSTVADLSPGDYAFTLERPGAEPHRGTVTVNRDATARIDYTFPLGAIKVTSVPAGAAVLRGGAKVGETPFTLAEQNPGDVEFQLALDGFEPATVAGHVDGGKTLTLSTVLRALDRVATLGELDQRPQPVEAVPPEIPARLTAIGGKVEIELIVARDGTTRDLRILATPNPEAGKICLEAASHWRFKPGLIDGRPVNVRVVVPFVLSQPTL